MARGTASKEVITQKILDTFKDSFKYDKEIRIPIMEDGEYIEETKKAGWDMDKRVRM